MVPEARCRYIAEPHIPKARSIVVSMLDAEVHHMANEERGQVFVYEHCRGHGLRQDLRLIEDVRVGKPGQVNKILDLPTSELRPDSIIFLPYLFSSRMERAF